MGDAAGRLTLGEALHVAASAGAALAVPLVPAARYSTACHVWAPAIVKLHRRPISSLGCDGAAAMRSTARTMQ